MRMLITTDQSCLVVSKVYLEDGYIPNVAGHTLSIGNEGTADLPGYLEPAIWFKVALMDTLCIDCRLRRIYWTESRGEEEEKVGVAMDEIDVETSCREESEELLRRANLLEECCVDLVNSLEEVFDSVHLLCMLFKKNRLSSMQLSHRLINLLHINILPLVKLKSFHLELLQHSIMLQEKYLGNLNDLILIKTIQLHEIKNSKKRNRQNLKLKINCSSEFKFQNGLVEILEKEFNIELEQNMFKFKDMVSEMDRWGGSEEDLAKLKIKMQETKAEIVSLNVAFEKLGNSKKKGGWLRYLISQLPVGDDAQLQKIYVQMDMKLKEIQKEIYMMMDQKLMVSSVIETIKGVSHDLSEGNESYGLEIEKKSRVQMSDILANSFTTRSFKSLPEQISIILKDYTHALTTNHLRTELDVRNILTSTLLNCKQQKLYNSLVNKVQLKKNISFNVFFKPNSKGRRQHSSEYSLNRFSRVCDLECSQDDVHNSSHKYSNSLPDIAKATDSTKSTLLGPCNATNVPTFHSYIENLKDFYEPEYNFGYVTEIIDQLKEEIPSHFASICSAIQLHIDKTYNELNFRKVWVIYENYFFEHILDLLIELYMTEYERKVSVFVEKISLLSVHDLDLTTSKITKLLGHHANNHNVLRVIETSTNESSSVNSEKTILVNFGKFFNSTEEINKGSSEVSSSSDFGDSFESNEVKGTKINTFENNCSLSNDLAIKNEDGFKASLSGIHLTPLPSVSSSELLYMDTAEDSDSKSVVLQACVLERFSKAYGYLRHVLVAKTLMKKTHYLSACLKEVSLQLERLSRETTGKHLTACNDDLMDTLILLLCNTTDHSFLAGLYVQIKLLTDYLASFFEYGEFKFTLTMFLGVCNHLQDKIFMKNYKQSNSFKNNVSLNHK